MFFSRNLIFLISFVFLTFPSFAKEKIQHHIAITKITSHPSLDLIHQGILDVLKTSHPNIKITQNNAQGNITIAAQIAQNFSTINPTVVVPITTPSAQTVRKAFQDGNTPIIFVGITDPIGANLLKSLSHPENNCTGVIDQPPVEQTLEIMKQVNPALKVVGVIYNAGETNSEFQIAALRKSAHKTGVLVREIPVSKSSDVQMAAASLIDDVDAIFLPNDNLIISSLEAILKIAQRKLVPVYASDPESVNRGAFAALAFDQYEMGRTAGKLILKVLKSGSSNLYPPIVLDNPKLYVNKEVAKKLGVSKELLETMLKVF